jgi:O6-methylguanine-DNA--protein-cysteine methyltransferase
MTIPKGYMSTYGISKVSGRPNPAVAPCHSAIDSDGSLGYAYRTAMKIKLLRMEVGAQNNLQKKLKNK